jgi:NAD(P)-dependent dehydrogenase (short-subunit alcohol dehydrogenase family)
MSKVALITGAGTGVGRAVATTLAADGFAVVVTGRRLEPLAETARLVEAKGGKALAVAADVGDEASVANLFAKAKAAFGRLDLLFNNAGVGTPAVPLEELAFAQIKEVIDTNLAGAFLCSQAAIRMFKSQDPQGGRIINNGSISAHVPRPHSAPYTATKHAITGLTRSLALDGRPHNIVCGQIDIGNAATPMTERMKSGVLQADGSLAAEPRMDVDHVAKAVSYMAGLPLESNVLFMTVMASQMPFVGRG